jgi:hypothetical protein
LEEWTVYGWDIYHLQCPSSGDDRGGQQWPWLPSRKNHNKPVRQAMTTLFKSCCCKRSKSLNLIPLKKRWGSFALWWISAKVLDYVKGRGCSTKLNCVCLLKLPQMGDGVLSFLIITFQRHGPWKKTFLGL